MISWLRSQWWTFRLRLAGAHVGRNFKVTGPLDIALRDGASLRQLEIGDDVQLLGRVYLRFRKAGRIVLETTSRISTEVWLVTANEATVRIGAGSQVGPYSILNGGHGVDIGERCLFGGFLYLNSSDHGIEKGTLIQEQGFTGAQVVIGDGAWVGGQVFVGKGVTIADGAIVGAGAVVIEDVAADHIAVGNPARTVGERPDPETL